MTVAKIGGSAESTRLSSHANERQKQCGKVDCVPWSIPVAESTVFRDHFNRRLVQLRDSGDIREVKRSLFHVEAHIQTYTNGIIWPALAASFAEDAEHLRKLIQELEARYGKDVPSTPD